MLDYDITGYGDCQWFLPIFAIIHIYTTETAVFGGCIPSRYDIVPCKAPEMVYTKDIIQFEALTPAVNPQKIFFAKQKAVRGLPFFYNQEIMIVD